MKVVTHNTAGTFSADLWRTGASGFTDASPNTSAPAAGTIAKCPPGKFLVGWGGGNNAVVLSVFLADGTSVQVRLWYYDDTMALWVSPTFMSATTLTYASTNMTTFAPRLMPGAKMFVQVIANTGATKVALIFR